MTVSEAPAKKPPHYYGWRHHVKKLTVTWARWLHIYLSMVTFAILLFFAVTGLTVNHPEWFASQQKTAQYKGRVAMDWVRPPPAKTWTSCRLWNSCGQHDPERTKRFPRGRYAAFGEFQGSGIHGGHVHRPRYGQVRSHGNPHGLGRGDQRSAQGARCRELVEGADRRVGRADDIYAADGPGVDFLLWRAASIGAGVRRRGRGRLLCGVRVFVR